MIKIQEHLDKENSEEFLNELAEQHWNQLNPKYKKNGAFQKKSLVKKCEHFEKETSTECYRKKYSNNNSIESDRHNKFFNFLTRNGALELKKLIVLRPHEFNDMQNDIFNIIKASDLYTGTANNYKQTTFGKLLSENIFNYAAFRSSDFCKSYLESMGFHSATCPYCNDNKLIITKVIKKTPQSKKSKAYLDIDHFYPKLLSPFFAVSFFNLIPACHDCNSRDKGDKPFTIEQHIHPYHESFEEKYTFKISTTSSLCETSKIELVNNDNKSIDKTVIDLNLNDRYMCSLSEANKLIELFNNYMHNIDDDNESWFKHFMLQGIPKERKDILKFQRAKMKRDILKQLDINNILGII